MPEPLVVQQVRAFQARLLAEEEEQFRQMAARWLEIEQALEGQISALVLEIESIRVDGRAPTQGQVMALGRLRSLLAQTQTEVERYQGYAANLISEKQALLVAAGQQDAMSALTASRITGVFDRLPVQAFENLVGVTADGTALATYLQGTFSDAAGGMVTQLLQGTALGWNPTKTARAMRDGLGVGLQRALNVARTEQLRAYRESSRMTYASSGVVLKYKRVASPSVRSCIACLMADGRIYDVGESFDEHNQGRCSLVPWVVGVAEPVWETGSQWFLRQSAADQEEILGKEYFKAWQGGAFTLEQLVTRHEDPVWGASLQVTPLKNLVAG